jgi:hypothetical protein
MYFDIYRSNFYVLNAAGILILRHGLTVGYMHNLIECGLKYFNLLFLIDL